MYENISSQGDWSLVVILVDVANPDSLRSGIEAATWEDAEWQ
jgi:hypothetical protein